MPAVAGELADIGAAVRPAAQLVFNCPRISSLVVKLSFSIILTTKKVLVSLNDISVITLF